MYYRFPSELQSILLQPKVIHCCSLYDQTGQQACSHLQPVTEIALILMTFESGTLHKLHQNKPTILVNVGKRLFGVRSGVKNVLRDI